MARACTIISFAITSFSWFSWYTLRSSTNRLCVPTILLSCQVVPFCNLLLHLTSSSLIPDLNKTPLASSYRSAETLHLLILLSQCAQISNLVLHFFIRVSTNLHTFSGTPIHAYRFRFSQPRSFNVFRIFDEYERLHAFVSHAIYNIRVRVLSLSFDSSLYIRYNTRAHVVNSTYYKYRILSIHDGWVEKIISVWMVGSHMVLIYFSSVPIPAAINNEPSLT